MIKRPTLAQLKAKELEEYEPETDSEDEAVVSFRGDISLGFKMIIIKKEEAGKHFISAFPDYSFLHEGVSPKMVLQEAFKKGIIKPGVNIISEEKPKVNNVPLLKEKLNDLAKDMKRFDWIERLDVTSKEAPIAPELYFQLEEEKSGHDPLVYDELKRESFFYRQAQDAILTILPKLKELGLLTKRPDDYFAEMAKSDEHMQKVKSHAIKKKLIMERIEKLRQIRAHKKLRKALNSQAKVAKEQKKKAILDEVKKYRKGDTEDLSFLDIGPKSGKFQQPKNKKKSVKQKYKDSKFGFGGKKRGVKKNTKTSLDGVEDKKRNFKAMAKKQKKHKAKRPGKSVRQKMKSKKH